MTACRGATRGIVCERWSPEVTTGGTGGSGGFYRAHRQGQGGQRYWCATATEGHRCKDVATL
ncbi:proline-rich receptor-like protein kinase PERK12 [Iris pallida]|uniref:Proline-rich receptor-like protein kinase PERK12 n=1 Tax=Iris pallida TaxID=29817 RepID=A0AAX6FC10_IRIPA|nr:proline-rich receptor-like protein kinase PERK12 [Iris pallida]